MIRSSTVIAELKLWTPSLTGLRTAFTSSDEEILIISNVPHQNALDFLDEMDQIIESDFHGVVDAKAVPKTVG